MNQTSTSTNQNAALEGEIFKALIENITEGVALFNDKAEQIYQSPSIQRMTGFSAEEYRHKPIFDFMHPLDREDAQEVFQLALASPGVTFSRQYRMLHQQGHYIWVEGTIVNRLHDAGLHALVANYRDITERKEAELQLLQSERQYHDLFASNPLPMWVIEENTFRFLSVNEAAIRHYGYSREEFLVMTAKDIRPQEDLEQFLSIKRVSDSGPKSVGIWKHIRKDGSIIWVDVRANSISYEGKKARLILAVDITERINAEEEVIKGERRFHTYLDNMLEGVQIIDFNWRYIYVNEAVAQHARYKRHEMIGKNVLELFPDLENTKVFEAYQKCFSQRTPVKMENEFTYPDGSKRWFKLSFQPVPEGIFILSTDITERKNSEKELSASYQTIADYKYALDESAIITITDAKGCITYANDNFLRISKYTFDEIKGQNPRMFNSGYHTADFFKNLWETIYAGNIWKGEMRNIAKDHTFYWADTTIVPFMDSTGKPYQFLVIRNDITERKMAEEKLLHSEANLNAIIENTIADIYSIDRQYRYIAFNQKLKHSIKKAYGLDIKVGDKVFGFLEKLDPHAATEWQGIYDRAFGGERQNFTKTFHLGKVTGCIAFSISPIYEGDKITGLSCFALDVTKQKNAEAEIIALNESLEQKVTERTAELELANRELESFSYTVSHDLQSPLRAMSGITQILHKDYSNVLDAEGKELLNMVSRSAKRMSLLIHELLDFSKLGKAALHRQPTDMNNLVQVTLDEIRFGTKDFKAKVNVSGLGHDSCDPALLRQVWANLISNAVKYSSKVAEPTIEIGANKVLGRTIYRVRDNGAGFDMKYAANLFRVFKRMHSEHEFEGTGVGLATVKRIIEKHGGTIWAEAKVNEGAAFYFTLC